MTASTGITELRKEARIFLESRLATPASENAILAIARHLAGDNRGDPACWSRPAMRDFLKRALRKERGRAKSESRHYSFNRHVALYQALRALGSE